MKPIDPIVTAAAKALLEWAGTHEPRDVPGETAVQARDAVIADVAAVLAPHFTRYCKARRKAP